MGGRQLALTNIKKRVILFIRWYKKLSPEYGWWASWQYALQNSGTHLLNGDYRYPTNWQELKAQGKKYDMFDL
jgi:hypothetical protein